MQMEEKYQRSSLCYLKQNQMAKIDTTRYMQYVHVYAYMFIQALHNYHVDYVPASTGG